MRADDKRHGTRAGYYAHRRAGQAACDDCKRAAAAQQARHEYNRSRGMTGRLDPTGTRRRLQALAALGYTWSLLDQRLGHRMAEKFASDRLQYVFPATAEKVAALYNELRDAPPPQSNAKERGAVTKATRRAERNGWPTPDAWLDIDDPDEQPDPGYRERTKAQHAQRDDVDSVVVQRLLAGDWSLLKYASKAERVELVNAWPGTLGELQRLTGLKPERYRKDGAA
jgi:hypothetical protein